MRVSISRWAASSCCTRRCASSSASPSDAGPGPAAASWHGCSCRCCRHRRGWPGPAPRFLRRPGVAGIDQDDLETAVLLPGVGFSGRRKWIDSSTPWMSSEASIAHRIMRSLRGARRRDGRGASWQGVLADLGRATIGSAFHLLGELLRGRLRERRHETRADFNVHEVRVLDHQLFPAAGQLHRHRRDPKTKGASSRRTTLSRMTRAATDSKRFCRSHRTHQ